MKRLFMSVIINNYNYARFLAEAIESALNQTYPSVEVIVVDDGSTDQSRQVIESYGTRVIPVFKENGGQASAFNEAFKVSRGEIICFLDSDDALLPQAMEKVAQAFESGKYVKAHWPLRVINEKSEWKGEVIPTQRPLEGNLRAKCLEEGPIYDWHFTPPTSGNAWAREFLKEVLPIPEVPFRLGGDEYLLSVAPIFGSIHTLEEPAGCYRTHNKNHYFQKSLDTATIRLYQMRFENCCLALRKFLKSQGVESDLEKWKKKNFNYLWLERLLEARKDMAALIPAEAPFVLADQNELGPQFSQSHHRAIPFMEKENKFWGLPADDREAVAELERLRKEKNAAFIVFWWAFDWWQEHYSGFREYLQSRYKQVLENDRLTIFDLRNSS